MLDRTRPLVNNPTTNQNLGSLSSFTRNASFSAFGPVFSCPIVLSLSILQYGLILGLQPSLSAGSVGAVVLVQHFQILSFAMPQLGYLSKYTWLSLNRTFCPSRLCAAELPVLSGSSQCAGTFVCCPIHSGQCSPSSKL